MASEQTHRRLAAILSADVVGYSRLMAEDEDATVRRLTAYREAIAVLIREHRGRVVDAPGDNLLAEFATATDAVEAATEIQRVIRARNGAVPEGRKMEFRIGVHLGEARAEGERLYGDAVNVAARLESLAEPGGICISDDVLHQVRRKLDLAFEDLGPQEVKNIPDPVHVYRVREVAVGSGRAGPRRVSAGAVAALVGATLVGIAVATYFTYGARSPSGDGPPLTSIAVLPFDDMSPGGDQKWLADGMAEELIETLSRIEALRVLARTSAFAMKGKDIGTVGDALRVGSVVEGSIRRSDDQLRVTAQLIRVSDGSHLWSARYDRNLSDVFATQTEIARAIAEAIRGELGIEYESSWHRNLHEPSDVRAYELVRRALDARVPLFTAEGIQKSIEYDEQALAIDPDYAQAHADLGLSYHDRWSFHGRADADLARARAEGERALAIDPTNGQANSLLATILIREHQWTEARRLVDRGLAHNPSNSTLRWSSAQLLAMRGRTAEAQIEMRRAVELDPWYWIWRFFLGANYMLAGEYDAAVDEMERAWDLTPSPLIRAPLAYAYYKSGKDAEALEANLRDLPPALEGLEAAMRQGFAEGGVLGMVRANVAWLVANRGHACTNAAGFDNSGALALLGEADAMFACLDRAVGRGDELYLLASDLYDPYRSDPRFTALLRRMNLAE